MPRKFVHGALEAKKTWSDPAEYVRAIDDLPLGPNVGSMLGHSDLRTSVLGLDRATGKVLWQKTAVTATPHEGYHHLYGSFASNAPATDGQRVYAFFGTPGVFCENASSEPTLESSPPDPDA